jgi:enoyl-CoA hydratase/carnithine racemase
MIFEKLNVSREGQVLFVEISAPPMNLEGPELIRDLVSLIQQAEADESVQVIVFKSADPDYFISTLMLLGSRRTARLQRTSTEIPRSARSFGT